MKVETQHADILWDATKAVLEQVYSDNTYIKGKKIWSQINNLTLYLRKLKK